MHSLWHGIRSHLPNECTHSHTYHPGRCPLAYGVFIDSTPTASYRQGWPRYKMTRRITQGGVCSTWTRRVARVWWSVRPIGSEWWPLTGNVTASPCLPLSFSAEGPSASRQFQIAVDAFLPPPGPSRDQLSLALKNLPVRWPGRRLGKRWWTPPGPPAWLFVAASHYRSLELLKMQPSSAAGSWVDMLLEPVSGFVMGTLLCFLYRPQRIAWDRNK